MMTLRFAVMFGIVTLGIAIWFLFLIAVGSGLEWVIRLINRWQIRRELAEDARRTQLTHVTWPRKSVGR